jgi:hypothetical protein
VKKEYCCIFCKKKLSRSTHLRRHLTTCKTKKILEKEKQENANKEKQEIIELQNKMYEMKNEILNLKKVTPEINTFIENKLIENKLVDMLTQKNIIIDQLIKNKSSSNTDDKSQIILNDIIVQIRTNDNYINAYQ